MEFKEEDYLMLSGVQHYVYCKRQWALIHIEQQWSENYLTTAGNIMHKRADEDDLFELRGDILTAHALRVFSRQLGISGKCDIVEFHRSKDGITLQGYDGIWTIVPVEYKHGSPKEGEEDQLQLCLQAMCLEEMFLTHISDGFLFYGEQKRRTKVTFSEERRKLVEKMILEMHELYKKGYTPQVKNSKKCNACSLKDICLPRLQKTESVSEYMKHNIEEVID